MDRAKIYQIVIYSLALLLFLIKQEMPLLKEKYKIGFGS